MKMRRQLYELSVILAILFAIALLALPTFTSSPKSVAVEKATLLLHQIVLQEEAYQRKNGHYIGVSGGKIRNVLGEGESDSVFCIDIPSDFPYAYAWTQVTDSTYRVTATGNIDSDPDLDVWSVDQRGIMTHLRVD
jgi:type II secretory pathway pseudopilin PulG